MAEKSSNKAQGRARPQAQSKGRGRSGQSQKHNPNSGGRSGGSSHGAANGTASRAGRAGQSGRGQRESVGDSGREESQQSGGGKVGETLKQHPITTAALGAGLTLLAAQGLRMAINARGQSGNEDSGSDDQDERDDVENDAGDASASGENDEGHGEEQQDEGDEGRGLAGRFRQGASSLGSKLGSTFRGSSQAIRRGAQSGFDRGRQSAEENWTNHPLLMAGVALAVGAAAGFLIPSTRQEDRLMGKTSDKLAGRFKKGGKEAFRQGRSLAGKVLHEAVNAASKEADREGLSPDRLGKKFKRVFSNVRDAVAEAVQED